MGLPTEMFMTQRVHLLLEMISKFKQPSIHHSTAQKFVVSAANFLPKTERTGWVHHMVSTDDDRSCAMFLVALNKHACIDAAFSKYIFSISCMLMDSLQKELVLHLPCCPHVYTKESRACFVNRQTWQRSCSL
jgi:hypothetical protein